MYCSLEAPCLAFWEYVTYGFNRMCQSKGNLSIGDFTFLPATRCYLTLRFLFLFISILLCFKSKIFLPISVPFFISSFAIKPRKIKSLKLSPLRCQRNRLHLTQDGKQLIISFSPPLPF